MTWGCEWRHAPEARAEDLGDFEESQWVECCDPKKGDFRLVAEARPVALWRVPHVMGVVDGKFIIEILCITLPYVETFNSKVIKGFVPELRSRYVFFLFRDSYVLCIYFMNIQCTFHIYVSWAWYILFIFIICKHILNITFLNKPELFFTLLNCFKWFELTKKRSRRYPVKTITKADSADDIAILANTPNQAETLQHSLERAATGIGLHVNAHKTEYMCYNQTGDISTLDGTPLKLVDKFTYLGSSVSSTEKDIDTRLTKAIDHTEIRPNR